MKKIPIAAAGGGVAIAGLMLSMVSWTSGELKTKASIEEVRQINHDLDKMDAKLDKVLWHLVNMNRAMNGKRVYIASEENGAIPN